MTHSVDHQGSMFLRLQINDCKSLFLKRKSMKHFEGYKYVNASKDSKEQKSTCNICLSSKLRTTIKGYIFTIISRCSVVCLG